MSKDRLKGTLAFWRVDPKELSTLDELAEYLNALINGSCLFIEKDGRLIVVENPVIERARIAEVGDMKIEIFSKEHPPPHFHVSSPRVDASFRIDNCKLIKGNISKKDYKAIKYFHQEKKSTIIEKWNSMRPTDCAVGLFRDK
ncbi:hypothetical protein CO110_04110 [Candidatus Desantisbacteria bacterium CG_4_9_14_3_um_filter_40_11]|uniref:DUF4160 domain-containing protein n=1 Tax=Candidatus Desantisbacteria bacterium CG_4_9_14_3_um_filter_40_11 TaxID=1974546 RepID=A0A2M8AU70_9BACT|nr:MAG: hypothetical protein CO110_04110 [Candidatus Desantisbacteria bacterium CG_4_9_14_3_um_filter_40_11]